MNKNQYMTTEIKNNDQRNTSLLKALAMYPKIKVYRLPDKYFKY